MHARLLALVCLLYVSVPAARAQLLGRGDVGVYLKTGDPPPGRTLDHMKAELEVLMRSVGVDLRWWNRAVGDAGPTSELVVLELHGMCEPPHRSSRPAPAQNTSLASSSVADGFVQPFSRVDCDALTRFIGASLAGMTHDDADRSYGRAMARVAAHELYHVLSKKSSHTQTGVAKANFTMSDLLANHFGFEDTVIANGPRGSSASTPAAAAPVFTQESSEK